MEDVLLCDGTNYAAWKMVGGKRADIFWFGSAGGSELVGISDMNADGTSDIVSHIGNEYKAWTVSNGTLTGLITVG